MSNPCRPGRGKHLVRRMARRLVKEVGPGDHRVGLARFFADAERKRWNRPKAHPTALLYEVCCAVAGLGQGVQLFRWAMDPRAHPCPLQL